MATKKTKEVSREIPVEQHRLRFELRGGKPYLIGNREKVQAGPFESEEMARRCFPNVKWRKTCE